MPSISESIRILLTRSAALFRKRSLDQDLEEELNTHIDLAIEENLAQGMTPTQARTQALRSFGGLTQTRETYRTHRGFPLLDQLGRDLHYGLRQLYRSPGFAVTAILTLALGLGANTAIFSLVNSLLLRPLAVPHAEELANISVTRNDFDQPNHSFSAPMLRALEKNHPGFQALAATSNSTLQVRTSSGNKRVSGMLVSGQYFAVLETPPQLGRYLTPADDNDNQPKGNPNGIAVVISDAFWHSWFNRAPDVIGRKLTIANYPFTIAGVMPATFTGSNLTQRPEIYVPLSAEPIIDAPFNNFENGWQSWWLEIVARRNPGTSLEQANAALQSTTTAIYQASFPKGKELDDSLSQHPRLVADPGSRGYSYLREQFRKPLVVVSALCAAMLLLACLNLASLLMARAAAREREIATRLAIGASRKRLIQQLMVESLLIATLGTTAGLAVSPLVSRFLARLLVGNNPDQFLDTTLDLKVFAFAAAVTLVATLLIGLLPALRATSGDLNAHIKNGSNGTTTRLTHNSRTWLPRNLLPRVLMATEVALALTLVIGAALLATSLLRLYQTGLGFEPKGLVNLSLDMDKQSLEGPALLRWYQQYADALSHQPGVKDVSFEGMPPLSGSMQIGTMSTPFSNGSQSIYGNTVAPNYFTTMRIPMHAGRDFNWQDTPASGTKLVLNETAARLLFPNRSAIGQTITGWKGKTMVVIAVVADTHYESIQKPAPPEAYRAMTQTEEKKFSYDAVVRIAGSPRPLATAARQLAAATAPDIPAPTLTTMSSQLDESIRSQRLMAMLSVFFAATALLVTAIGLYGTLAYATARRTSEIGIRMALGAQRLQVVLLVFRENAWTASLGSLAGLGIALLGARALTSFLYGTSIHDPWVLIGSVTSLALIASAASLLPAIRASRIEPMQALRSE